MVHMMNDSNKCLTTDDGVKIVDNSNSLTVGDRGPVLLEDMQLIEKLARFNRERIPERVVHAKGAGAKGYFVLYNSMKEYTMAKFLQIKDCKTPVIVRFSTVIGSRGSADTARDPRGFAVKFYTEEGNYDLVGNNLPVFFVRDSIRFPDLIHAFKPSPDTNLQNKNRFWDFVSSSPETLHMITWVFSDRGTVRSYRTMEGFGVNTYVWVNNKGDRKFVKYHWKPLAGLKSIDREEAELLAGIDPDVSTRDLYTTLEKGKTVEYELFVQLMDIEEQFNCDFDPLDATKVWPEDVYPLMKVGKLVIDKAPENFFAEIEQVAFCPGNLIKGVEASADKLLQGRLFAYNDTQRYRIGANFKELPVNRPHSGVNNNNQDGTMEYIFNKGEVNYKPNTLNDNHPLECGKDSNIKVKVQGDIERKKIPMADDYKQAGQHYRDLNKIEQDHLVDNIVDDMKNVNLDIKVKMVDLFTKCDKEFGYRVKCGLSL